MDTLRLTTVVFVTLHFSTHADYNLSVPQVAINLGDTCFAQHGRVACWGNGYYGQLGRGNRQSIGGRASDIDITLNVIDLGEDFVVQQIAGGSDYHRCAVSLDHRLKCWGKNNYGVWNFLMPGRK